MGEAETDERTWTHAEGGEGKEGRGELKLQTDCEMAQATSLRPITIPVSVTDDATLADDGH